MILLLKILNKIRSILKIINLLLKIEIKIYNKYAIKYYKIKRITKICYLSSYLNFTNLYKFSLINYHLVFCRYL